MARPLPVEVTSDWWDYFVDGVGVVSGLATAGALLIAALAYRRQVDDARRAQAAMVTVTTGPEDEGRGSDIIVENRSNRPIFRVMILAWPVGQKSMRPLTTIDEIRAYGLRIFDARTAGWPDIQGARVTFADGSGHRWIRSSGGELRGLGRHWFRRRVRDPIWLRIYAASRRLRR